MSQSLDRFKAQLRGLWSPAVAVIASPEAEQLCWDANGLTVAELLRPFGVLRKMNGGMGVPIRTPAEQPIRLYEWNLRFYDVAEMKQPPQEVANQHLAGFLQRAGAAAAAPLPDLQQLIDSVAAGQGSPWYDAYFQEFFRMLNFGGHDTMDHPVACLLVLPSSFEGEAVGASSAFADLFEERAPPLVKHLVRDSHAVVHYAFLHDARDPRGAPSDAAAAALNSLTSAFGPAGHVLTVAAAAAGDQPRADPALWEACVHQRWEGGPPLPRGDAGRPVAGALTAGAAAAIAAAVEELAVRKLAPHVEARIRQLDTTALSARRGFKNQLKSLLFRKSAATSPLGDARPPGSPRGSASSPRSPTAASQYSHSSVEAQLRALADLALMVGDCDTALATLRLLAADYKSDKAYMHFASAQEAMAAATVLYDGPPSDAMANLKEAFYRYDQVAQHAQHGSSRATWYATRAAVLLAAYLTAIGRAADASWIAMKAHFAEEDARAALLIERAALLLLRARRPRVRKFAFHSVLAGLRYSKGGAAALAARSYALAAEVYRGRRWEVVEEHVQEALGKSCRERGDAAGAVAHFAATLLCTQVPAGVQSLHMAQFVEALQTATAELGYAPVVEVPLPGVNTAKVEVTSSGQASFANVAARQVAREAWGPLEAAVGQPPEAGGNWLDGGGGGSRMSSKMSLASAAAGPGGELCCCVGEDVGVDVEIRNPLQIELALTKLRLACTFDAPAGGGAQQQPGSASSTPRAGVPGTAAPSLSFQAREERITLHPEEQALVHLRARPLRTGTLHIDGVAWELNGVVAGQKPFAIRRRGPAGRPSASQAALADADADDPPGGLTVKVMPPMPRLEVTLEGLPSSLLVGQVVRCVLRLKNVGAMTLHALRCAVDSPAVFLDLGPSQQVSQKAGATVFALGGTKLGVNEAREVAVLVRPTRPGPFSFNMCWYYEPLVKLEALPYRTVRATFAASALPALEMGGWSAPLAGADGQRLLVLRGLNLQGIETFTLKSFGVAGGRWRAALAAEKAAEGGAAAEVPLGHVVGPETAVVLHALLSPAPEGAADEADLGLPLQWTHLAREEARAAGAAAGKAGDRPALALLRWEATGIADGVVEGLNVVRINRSSDGPGVTVRLVAPPAVPHDFAASPSCGVDLALEICHELPAALTLRWGAAFAEEPPAAGAAGAADGGGQIAPAPKVAKPGRGFVWQGAVGGTLAGVAPGAMTAVPLRLAAYAPGWVSVDEVWVEWTCNEVPQLSGTLAVPACHVFVGETPLGR